MNVHRAVSSSATLLGKIFCAGGRERNFEGPFLDSVESYDPVNEVWTLVASMMVPRCFFSLVSFGPYLWAVGGWNYFGCIKDFEIYSPEKNYWMTLKPMPTARANFASIFLGNQLYAIGGYDGAQALRTMEVYDPEKDEWNAAPSPNWKRFGIVPLPCNHEVTTFPRMPSHSVMPFKDLNEDLIEKGVLLVMGGVGDNHLRAEVEAFIPSEQKWFKIRNITDAPNNEMVAMTDGSSLFVLEYQNKRFRSLDPLEMKWRRLSDPPVYRNKISATLIRNEIFLMGGEGQDGKQCDVYNITKDSWSKTTNMILHRLSSSSAAIQGKIICAGGRESEDNGPYLDSVESYDPQKRVWTFVASMSVPRSSHSLVSFGPYVGAVGGINHLPYVKVLEIYDPKIDFWITLKPMPTGRGHLSATFFNNHLYAVGGFDGHEGELLSVEVYDPEKDEWTAAPSLNWKRNFHTSLAIEREEFPKMTSHSVIPFKDLTKDVIMEGVLLVMGGFGERRFRSEVEGFIPSEQKWFKIRNIRDAPNVQSVAVADGSKVFVLEDTNKRFRSLDTLEMKWRRLSDPPINRSLTSATLISNEIFWIGSNKEDDNHCDVYNITENSWYKTTVMNMHRVQSSLSALQGNVFCAGGKEGAEPSSFLDSVESYNPKKRVWTFVASMSVPRWGHSLVSFSCYLWAVGGFNISGTLKDFEMYDPSKDVWITLMPMPTARCFFTANFLGNHLYAAGGFRVGNELIDVDVYDPETDKWTKAPSLNWKRKLHASVAFQQGESTFPKMPSHSVIPFKDLTKDLLQEGVLLVMGGFDGRRLRSEVEAFIPSEQKWFKIRNISDAPNHESVAVKDGSTIFVLDYKNGRFRSLDPLKLKWKRLSDPPVKRSITSASLLKNLIFWIGNNEKDGNQCDVYNITENSWFKTTEMNVHRVYCSLSTFQDKIFCAGGREGNQKGPVLDSVETYDPEKRDWTFVASMSVPRYDHRIVSFGPYLWALGGYNGSFYLQDLEIYDPIKDIWITLMPMPTARSSFTANFLGNHLYAVGGYGGESELINVDVYDPETDQWTAAPSLNWRRKFHASLAFKHGVSTFPKMPSHSVMPFKDLTGEMINEGVLLVMGGFAGDEMRSGMEAIISSEQEWVQIRNFRDGPYKFVISVTVGSTFYVMDPANRRFRSLNPLEMKWKRLSDPPEYRIGMTASLLGSEIYLMGGENAERNSSIVYNIGENSWLEAPEMKVQRMYAGSATIEGKVFCAGGMAVNDRGPTLVSVEFYDPIERKWSYAASMEMPRNCHSLVSFSGYLWAVGGKNSTGVVTELECYIPEENIWATLTPMHTGRSNLSATFFQNRLYAIGGSTDDDETNSVEVYDPKVGEWSIAKPLNTKRQGHGAFVIEK